MKTTIILAASLLLTPSMFGANFSGKWILQAPGRGGRVAETVLQLNQAGSSLTGTLGGPVDPGAPSPGNNELLEPKVDGETISFYVWRGSDQPAKVIYKGTMVGDEIHFTVTGGPTRQNSGLAGAASVANTSQDVVAKRTR